jgi:outer membrane receptor for ferrienterochelin and colicin
VLAVPTAATKNYVDMGFGFQLTDSLYANFTIANLLDTDPPMMADSIGSNNTDTTMYDIFGRSYTLSLSMRLLD